MIKINLLPLEKRKVERAPLPRFWLVGLDVAAMTIAIFVVAYFIFEIKKKEEDLQEKARDFAALEKDSKDFDLYTNQLRTKEGRLREIAATTTRKVEWWRAIDALWEVIHFHPRVWIDDIGILEGAAAQSAARSWNPDYRKSPPFGLRMRCNVAGRDVEQMTRFRMALKRDPELRKFFDEVNWDAQWHVSEEREFVEQYSLPFEITLIGRPQAEKPPAPAGGAR